MTTPCWKTLNIDSDNRFVLQGVQNEETEAYINDATCTATLIDADGAALSGETWPLSMSYIAASNGNYEVTFQDVIKRADGSDLVDGDLATIVVEIDGDGLQAERRFAAVWRTAGTCQVETPDDRMPSLDDVIDAYLLYGDWEEYRESSAATAVARCRKFVTACVRLLGILPTQSISSRHTQASFNVALIESQLKHARRYLTIAGSTAFARPTTHIDLQNFRD